MDVDAAVEGQIAIVRVRGFLDTKASPEFERKMVELLQAGARAFAVDFSRLDMITSAGIRVLMMVVKRVGADRLALWGLNEQVQVVFSIAGLAGVFQIVDSQPAAVERVQSPAVAGAAAAPQASRMTRLVNRLLGNPADAPAPRSQSETVSKMTEEVASLLTRPRR